MCSRHASFGTTVTTTTVCQTTYLYNPILNVECSTAMNLTQSTVTDIHSLCIDYHSRWSQKPKHFHTHVYRLIHTHTQTCIVLLYLLSFIFAHAIKGKQMRNSFFFLSFSHLASYRRFLSTFFCINVCFCLLNVLKRRERKQYTSGLRSVLTCAMGIIDNNISHFIRNDNLAHDSIAIL